MAVDAAALLGTRTSAGTMITHYNDVIMTTVASQITSVSIVYSTGCPRADKRKHQSPASLALVRGIHRSTVNFLHKGPVTRRMFPFDDIIMQSGSCVSFEVGTWSLIAITLTRHGYCLWLIHFDLFMYVGIWYINQLYDWSWISPSINP